MRRNNSRTESDDCLKGDARRDPEALRQLEILEKLQEELLDLQKTR